MLCVAMVTTPLAGCNLGGFGSNSGAVNVGTTGNQGTNTGISDVNGSTIDTELIEYIKGNYASSSLPEDYNQPIYNLPEDYVFEFECSEQAGYEAYRAFAVYDNPNYVNAGRMTYTTCDYENGKIYVKPSGALYLTENGSSHVDDNWGSLNQLYLVQYIDLETGKDLERPIVTPFTIEHDMQAPVLKQGVDENNSYTLSWKEVPGAVEYRIYEFFSDCAYKVECTTTETSVTVNEFDSQKRMDEYESLIEQEYIDAGYNIDTEGIMSMNYGVRIDEDLENGYFLVVAVDAQGNQSGISNIVDVRDVAAKLPYQVCENVVTVDIASVEDIPAYVEVEMVDGSVQQMIIDYHGAQTYIYPDEPLKMSIRAKVANTLFDSFLITLNGMTHADVMAEASYVTERQDELLSKTSAVQEPEINVSYVPSEEMNHAVEEQRENTEPGEVPSEKPDVKPSEEPSEVPSEEPSEVPSEEPSEVPSEEPSEVPSEEPSEVPSEEPGETPSAPGGSASVPVQLMYEVAGMVQQGLNILGTDHVNQVMFAQNDLQAWIAMCLMTQQKVIPIPVEVFQDAANLDYAVTLLSEAYRQNPTSGMISNVGYASEYQAIVVEYLETPEVRMEKAQAELEAAYNIANQVTNSGMSDYEKVLAINDYFRMNASYDYDSMSTEIEDFSTLSEAFIDAHTPYGIICKNYGVCESYSEAFILTARFAGLEAICEMGALYGGAHEWNRVKVDDSWCVLDVTNNDVDELANALFNVTDEQIAGILVPDNAALTDSWQYAADDHTKEYYYVNGMAVDNLADADEIIAQQLKTADCAYVRIPSGTSEAELQDVLSAVYYEHGVNITRAGVKMNILVVMK